MSDETTRDTERLDWRRYRFHANPVDPRPMTFPPPGPYWISGEAGDGTYAVVVAYLPADVDLHSLWPEADEVEFTEEAEVRFSSRFARPQWWDAAMDATPEPEEEG